MLPSIWFKLKKFIIGFAAKVVLHLFNLVELHSNESFLLFSETKKCQFGLKVKLFWRFHPSDFGRFSFLKLFLSNFA